MKKIVDNVWRGYPVRTLRSVEKEQEYDKKALIDLIIALIID